MKIILTVEIKNIDQWDVDWSNEYKAKGELAKLEHEAKGIICDHAGIDYNSLSIKSELEI